VSAAPPPLPRDAILCHVCRAGALRPKTVYWLDGPPMIVGYFLLVLGCMGLAVGAALLLLGDMSHDKAMGGSGFSVLTYSVPAAVVGVVLTARRRVLCCDRCRASVPTV
jgi:hypothetical protein